MGSILGWGTKIPHDMEHSQKKNSLASLVDVKWYFLVILICILHFLDGLLVKNPPSNAGDMDLTPRLGRSPGKENGSPLQYSCLEDPLDRKA